jgi:hypothetical protein
MRTALFAFVLEATLIVSMWTGTGVVYASPKKVNCTLSGVVLDSRGKPVHNAVVTYQSAAGYKPHAVRTDTQGRFTISKLRWDNYDVRASAKGHFSDWEKNVMVRSGQDKSLTLRLTGDQEALNTSAKITR